MGLGAAAWRTPIQPEVFDVINMACRVAECSQTPVRWGYCWMHYQRVRKYGSPGPAECIGKSAPLEVRFWNHVQLNGPLPDDFSLGACHVWVGAASNGYGLIGANSRHIYVHRLAYELARGPIPPGGRISWRCGNTLCVRPDHLLLKGVGIIR